MTLKRLLLTLVLIPLILFGINIVKRSVDAVIFTKSCDGIILVSGGSASCVPKIDLSKPPAIIQRLADKMNVRDLERLIK